MRYKILVVDDDPLLRELANLWLTKAGHSVVLCAKGEEVTGKVREGKPDLVLLDVLIGASDGIALCAALKKDPRTRLLPVILISGKRMESSDMVEGLEGGADDYMVKPLRPPLLLAKIEAVMRRIHPAPERNEILKRYGLTLDPAARRVKIAGDEVILTRKEFDLLNLFLMKPGVVLTPAHLLETVWGYELESYNDPHTVEVHMSSLKRKLGKPFASRLKNITGIGYRLD